MANGDEESKSHEDLELERSSSEKAKIGLPEIIIVLLVSASSELIEWLGDLANLIPVLGQAIWFLTYGYGLLVSVAIFLWSLFRGMYNGRKTALKLALMIGGPILDLLTAGLFPETLTLAAAIIIHNKLETDNMNKALGLISKLGAK